MNQRKAVRPGEPAEPRVELVDGVWHVRALEPARQVLRARHQTTQAGFTAEFIPSAGLEHRPILISDGPAHDEQRSDVARFFAPAVVAGYEDLMVACAERRLSEAGERLRLDDLALHFAVEVTAEIVGLSHDRPRDTPAARERRLRAMSARLVSFFRQPPFDLSRPDLGRTPRQWLGALVNGVVPVATYWFADVRPAIRQRRRRPGPDVLSHLIGKGYSRVDLLIEAVTYGTAGMVTTREFIAMAAWHLLTDDALRERYLGAGREDRFALLHEIVRLEPPVGHLYRRATADIGITDGEQAFTIRAGEVIDLYTRPANVDPQALGDEPLRVCPHRPLPKATNATVLSFGDGAHRCPGQPLAIWEADVLLTRLLARRPRLVREPRLGWDDMIAGYTLREFEVELGSTDGADVADADVASLDDERGETP